jgi:purine-binding chemotaxis protein CheW
MRGVINLRGAVVPILDLRCRFGLGYTEATKNHVVMIVNVGTRVMGILVDAVSDILTISAQEIRAVPSIDLSDGETVLKGLVNLDDRMVALLVLEKLFDSHFEICEDSLQKALTTSD